MDEKEPQAKDCPSNHTCSKCNQFHPSSLHDEWSTKSAPACRNHSAAQSIKSPKSRSSVITASSACTFFSTLEVQIAKYQKTAHFLELPDTKHSRQILTGGFFDSHFMATATENLTIHPMGNCLRAFGLQNFLIKDGISLSAAESDKLNRFLAQKLLDLYHIAFPEFSDNSICIILWTDNIDTNSHPATIKAQ